MKKFLKRAALIVALAVPTIVFAQEANGGGDDERRRFWGASQTCGTCTIGYQMCTDHYYVFWIDVSSGEAIPVACKSN